MQFIYKPDSNRDQLVLAIYKQGEDIPFWEQKYPSFIENTLTGTLMEDPTLIDQGVMKSISDIVGLKKYLVDMGIIGEENSVSTEEELIPEYTCYDGLCELASKTPSWQKFLNLIISNTAKQFGIDVNGKDCKNTFRQRLGFIDGDAEGNISKLKSFYFNEGKSFRKERRKNQNEAIASANVDAIEQLANSVWCEDVRSSFSKGGTIYSDTPIIPEIIADQVARDCVDENGKTKGMEDAQKFTLVNKLSLHLVEKANQIYANSEHFRNKMTARGNKGRDSLYAFMKHWGDAYIAEQKFEEGGSLNSRKVNTDSTDILFEVQVGQNIFSFYKLPNTDKKTNKSTPEVMVMKHFTDFSGTELEKDFPNGSTGYATILISPFWKSDTTAINMLGRKMLKGWEELDDIHPKRVVWGEDKYEQGGEVNPVKRNYFIAAYIYKDGVPFYNKFYSGYVNGTIDQVKQRASKRVEDIKDLAMASIRLNNKQVAAVYSPHVPTMAKGGKIPPPPSLDDNVMDAASQDSVTVDGFKAGGMVSLPDDRVAAFVKDIALVANHFNLNGENDYVSQKKSDQFSVAASRLYYKYFGWQPVLKNDEKAQILHTNIAKYDNSGQGKAVANNVRRFVRFAKPSFEQGGDLSLENLKHLASKEYFKGNYKQQDHYLGKFNRKVIDELKKDPANFKSVFMNPEVMVLRLSGRKPLSSQLRELTGDSYNTIDFLEEQNSTGSSIGGILTHIASGRKFTTIADDLYDYLYQNTDSFETGSEAKEGRKEFQRIKTNGGFLVINPSSIDESVKKYFINFEPSNGGTTEYNVRGGKASYAGKSGIGTYNERDNDFYLSGLSKKEIAYFKTGVNIIISSEQYRAIKDGLKKQ